MSLMDAMSRRLGPLDSWPTHILQLLFLDRPSPVRTSSLKKVISFFYGNDVPLKLAYTFYNACSVRGDVATSRFVVDQTKAWYFRWHQSRYKRHMAEYYNMLFRNFYYINGSQLNQRELVLPEITVMQFGIDDKTHPHKIRARLEVIRDMEI